MDHADHVRLLRPANIPPGGTWADLGAGSGAFTLALRELTGPSAHIYAVDKDARSLRQLEQEYRRRFDGAGTLHTVAADFARPVELPPLDGALMANSLHYFRDADPRARGHGERFNDKLSLLTRVRSMLKPGGVLLLVEYNVDSGNMWVPDPLSFETWRGLAPRAGFSEPRLLGVHPSSFLREFYSAACARDG